MGMCSKEMKIIEKDKLISEERSIEHAMAGA